MGSRTVIWDLDNVICQTTESVLRKMHEDGMILQHGIDHITDWYWKQIPVAIEVVMAYYSKDSVLYNADHFPQAISTIFMIKREFPELKQVIATARPERSVFDRSKLKTWLSQRGLESIPFFYVDGDKKCDFYRENDGVILIEDKADTVLQAAECGLDTFLIDRPWNRELVVTHEHVTRLSFFELEHLCRKHCQSLSS